MQPVRSLSLEYNIRFIADILKTTQMIVSVSGRQVLKNHTSVIFNVCHRQTDRKITHTHEFHRHTDNHTSVIVSVSDRQAENHTSVIFCVSF